MTSKATTRNTAGGNDTSLQAVLENQKAIEKAKKTISKLEEAISAQESIIATAAATVKVPESMDRKREDLLAEIAVGNATSDQLTNLDAEISRQKKTNMESSAKAELVIAPARQAVAGLRRKREQAEVELNALTEERTSLREALYWEEAEKAGAEYIRTANELHALLKRLLGLNTLFEGGLNSLGISTSSYGIPKMRLNVFKDQGGAGPYREYMFHGDQFNWAREASPLSPAKLRDAEIERLRALGVE